MKTRYHVLFWFLALCGALMVYTCVKIEVLNARVGYYLPREFSDSPYTNPKWRGNCFSKEENWLRIRLPQIRFEADSGEEKPPTPEEKPLTSEEEKIMKKEVAQARANNELRGIVGSLGLLQYLLVPLVFFGLLFFCVSKRCPRGHRIGAGVMSGLALVCGFFMIYRGYFTSLGWQGAPLPLQHRVEIFNKCLPTRARMEDRFVLARAGDPSPKNPATDDMADPSSE